MISIHAPREGSDGRIVKRSARKGISIHAPREGSDTMQFDPATGVSLFLSTLPARGATMHRFPNGKVYIDFYPRSPRGERRGK